MLFGHNHHVSAPQTLLRSHLRCRHERAGWMPPSGTAAQSCTPPVAPEGAPQRPTRHSARFLQRGTHLRRTLLDDKRGRSRTGALQPRQGKALHRLPPRKRRPPARDVGRVPRRNVRLGMGPRNQRGSFQRRVLPPRHATNSARRTHIAVALESAAQSHRMIVPRPMMSAAIRCGLVSALQ